MGGQPCKAKALLNGRTIQSESGFLIEMLQGPDVDLPDVPGYEIVRHLNAAEDAVFKAKRIFLETQGFKGPWPHSLSDSDRDYQEQAKL